MTKAEQITHLKTYSVLLIIATDGHFSSRNYGNWSEKCDTHTYTEREVSLV